MWSCRKQHPNRPQGWENAACSDFGQAVKHFFAIMMPPPDGGGLWEDVENILLKLIQAADYDLEKAEKELFILMSLIRLPVKAKIHQLHGMFRARACSRHS